MAPELEPKVMQAVEALDYRVSVGDVAANAGLRIPVAEQGLLALASEVGGHLQVADSGDIAYTFPKNFRSVLFQKYWQLRLKQWLGQAWKILFYLIRMSFGVVLILSIGILAIALIIAAVAAMSAASSKDGDNDSSVDLSGVFHFLGTILESIFRLMFYADWIGGGYSGGYTTRGRSRSQRSLQKARPQSELNFLEAIFSFLFGDGDPNADLDDRRWQSIAQVIRSNQGAIAAEQVLPFLDESKTDPDDAILPVLTRFQGQPQVSPAGELVYQFPELQVTAGEDIRAQAQPALQEHPWRFSKATSGQLWGAGLLGAVNAGLAIFVGLMLPDLINSGMGFLVFVGQIYPLLLVYGLGFLLIPLVRWQVGQWRDRRIRQRNQHRQSLAQQLHSPDNALRAKLAYAQQFANRQQLSSDNAAYTTETDLVEQELDQQAKLDAEWERRLQSGF